MRESVFQDVGSQPQTAKMIPWYCDRQERKRSRRRTFLPLFSCSSIMMMYYYYYYYYYFFFNSNTMVSAAARNFLATKSSSRNMDINNNDEWMVAFPQRTRRRATTDSNANSNFLHSFTNPSFPSTLVRSLKGVGNSSDALSPYSSSISSSNNISSSTISGNGQLTLSTPYQPDNASFGTMFTIYALKDITITSMNIYTTYETRVATRVLIYTLQGNFEGKEETPDAWNIICNATITTAIAGDKTLIPPGDSTFTRVPIPAGYNQSFYVTLEQPRLSYRNGKSGVDHVGDLLVRNDEVMLFIGSAVSRFPFKSIIPLRKFNGDILYEMGLPATKAPTPSPTYFVPWGDGLKLLPTGFDGTMRGYGAVFTIHSLQKDVKVQTLEFHCAATGKVDVQVYSHPGNYNQTELSTSDRWILISNTTVISSSVGKGTAIPQDNFQPFRISKGNNHTLYITLSGNNLLYTSVTKPSDALYVTDKFIAFYVGKGVNKPFLSTIYDARVFNGVIHYVTEVNNETAVPTPVPISPWIESFHVDRVITSTFEGGTGGYGCMFEIHAKNDLVVRSVDLHISNTTSYDVEIWTKQDSYVGFEGDEAAWKEVAKVTVQGRGLGTATQIDPKSFEGIAIPSGSLQSLYVTLQSPELVYTKKTDLFRGDVFGSDNNIEICTGTGVG